MPDWKTTARMNFTHSSRKSWALCCLSAAQRPPQSARPPVSANKVAFHLVQVTKAPADKAFEHKVCNGCHQAHQNSATDPRSQAVSPGSGQCFGANEIRKCPRIRPCPPRVPKTSGSQSRPLHQNDLGTENSKDLEMGEDHSLGKTWHRSTSCCKLSTHIPPKRMLQAAGTHHLAENLPNCGRPCQCQSGWLPPWLQHLRPSHSPHNVH